MTADIKFSSDMRAELIQSWGSDEMIARAARVSTARDQVDGIKIEGLIKYLVAEGHWSTLEHCGITVRIEAPLFILGQFVRHRHISVNVQSGRYSEFEPEFYVPEGRSVINSGSSARPEFTERDDRAEVTACHDIESSARKAWTRYRYMTEAGVANEVARNVLPQSTYTSWYASANLHAWFDYVAKRNGSDGHPQIEHVELAREIEMLIAQEFPIAYGAWSNG